MLLVLLAGLLIQAHVQQADAVAIQRRRWRGRWLSEREGPEEEFGCPRIFEW
ncbi:hypothetical protein O6H91_09G075100 [Diphasiastrum complanatum]|uniref:Uncharacterized protein n=1 Tax=Diphasiastrum complanatum TaxID=34168 RepID=A0ACC2CQW0_DIPCM|nr:hypothetical protein O6H91_09G075100 [Diphasiastrum complanatum]